MGYCRIPGANGCLKIIVCIKQVPHVSELRFDYEKKTLIREGIHNEINPFDRRAITFAVESRKRYGGEAVVMTMGPPQAKDALIEAMSMGMDRSVHLLDRAFAGSDTLATSRALAAAIRNEMPVDLVLCDKYSVDGTFYAMDNWCTHEQGNLSEGQLNMDILTCPDHGAQFDAKTGKVLAGPDGEPPDTIPPEKTYTVKVQGDDVMIEIP